jgi:uncharacterized membrane protein YfcA
MPKRNPGKRAPDRTGSAEKEPGARARKLDGRPIKHRLRLRRASIAKLCWFLCGYVVLVALAGWLVDRQTGTGTFFHFSAWLFPTVIALAFLFETVDSAAGMGFGTALTPLLLALGHDPLTVVPTLLIVQAITGLVTASAHHEFQNVQFSIRKGLNEATRLMLLIALSGVAAVIVSIVLVYLAFKLPASIIESYVAILVLVMGIVALVQRIGPRGTPAFRPKRMIGFAVVAGINKGIGAGGYGPVVTLGQLYAGVYEKSAAAITSLAEAWVSVAGAITFFAITAAGIRLDLELLPSLLAGSLLAAIGSPYLVRILPNRIISYLIPGYAMIIAAFLLAKLYLS